MNFRRRGTEITELLCVLCLFVVFSGCSKHSRFLERSVTVGDQHYAYRVWLPAHYTKLHHWPVILYLHGSGERGDDNELQLGSGFAPALENAGERWPAIVVFPQCRSGQEWYGDMEQQALAALEQSIREFHGDRRRVYVTGISMGGSGAWYFARHRHIFAAAVPVCGEVARDPTDAFPTEPPPDLARIAGAPDPYATLAALLDRLPVWVFHGSDDDEVPVTQSRNMVDALRHAGDPNVRFTEYGGVGHDSWDLAYADPNLPRWLFQQRLK
ncbi:MAG TPA: prolyl oligopeptidase family serine peptidase [Thermoanaerobaculia bacterium]|nr:prolyl oligopeptidase family serine peptidase [Thermoanaerobaculia bacterium]